LISVTPAAQGGLTTFNATFNGVTVSTTVGIQATGLDLLAPWPKFRGGTLNQGVGNGITGTSTLSTSTVIYAPQVSYDAIESSPAIGADGTIYLESGDGVLHGFLPGGADKWGANPAIFGQYVSSVAIASPTTMGGSETLYVGGQTGGISGLDALFSINAGSGATNWTFQIPTNTAYPRAIMGSPALAENGTIYVPSLNGYLYAVTPTGTLAWSYKTAGASESSDAGATGIESSPAVGPDGTIYFGSDDGHLYALRPNGTLKWVYPSKGTLGSMESSPTIAANGTIYIGCDDGHLYAINPNGSKLWSASIGAQAWYSSPSVGPDGTVYICNDPMQYGSVFAFNGTTGAKEWQFTQVNLGGVVSPQQGFKGSPALAPGGLNNAGVLFVGGMDGVLYGVNMADGSLYGYIPLGTQALMGSPALATSGTIYIASHNGSLYSIN
jgi:outer membrane protein assembly factor BamB